MWGVPLIVRVPLPLSLAETPSGGVPVSVRESALVWYTLFLSSLCPHDSLVPLVCGCDGGRVGHLLCLCQNEMFHFDGLWIIAAYGGDAIVPCAILSGFPVKVTVLLFLVNSGF